MSSPETPVEMKPLLVEIPVSLIIKAGSPQALTVGSSQAQPPHFLGDELSEKIYDFEERIERHKLIMHGLRNGGMALGVIDRLTSLGLNSAAVSNQASHLVAVLRLMDFVKAANYQPGTGKVYYSPEALIKALMLQCLTSMS